MRSKSFLIYFGRPVTRLDYVFGKAGVLVALLGAVTAFLLAPQPGRESRERLVGYARRTGEDLRQMSDKATDAWEEVVLKGQDFIDEASSAVKEALDAGRDAMRREREQSTQDYTP